MKRILGALVAILAGVTLTLTQPASAIAAPAESPVEAAAIEVDWAYLYNLGSGDKYLSIAGAVDANGSNAIIYRYSGTNDQIWQPVAVSGSTTRFYLRNYMSWRRLGIAGASKENLAHAVLWSENSSTDQQWEFYSVGSGYYQIRNVNSQKCLGVEAAATANNSSVVQHTCNSSNDQVWAFV